MLVRLALAVFLSSASIALAQSGNAVGSGLGNNAGTMTGANIDTVNGTNANGTPMAQSPGASMTVGAGNSTMLPGISGGTATPSLAPPPKIVHGTENGNVNTHATVKPTQ
jgi:hypothetical protein